MFTELTESQKTQKIRKAWSILHTLSDDQKDIVFDGIGVALEKENVRAVRLDRIKNGRGSWLAVMGGVALGTYIAWAVLALLASPTVQEVDEMQVKINNYRDRCIDQIQCQCLPEFEK